MKILIVDDERFVIRGIKVLLEREGFDLEILCAFNGLEALKVVEANHPDIIVTDVRMPIMDGLEFCKEIKDKGISSKIIIVSGFQEFEYARKAVEYGVKKYILKPINHHEFAQMLHDTVNELVSEKRNERTDMANKEKIKKKFLADAVIGIGHLPSAIDEILSAGIDMVKNEYVLVLMAVTIRTQIISEYNDKTKGDSFAALFEKMADSYPYHMIFAEYRPCEFIILLEVKKQGIKPVINFLNVITKKCTAEFRIGCSIGISGIHTTLQELETALTEARQAINISFLEGNSSPQCFDSKKYGDFFPKDISGKSFTNIQLVYDVEQRLLKSLRNINLNECIEHINYFFNELRRQKSEFGQIHMAVLELYICLARFIADIGNNTSEIFNEAHFTYETLSNYKNMDDLMNFLIKVIKNIVNYMGNVSRDQKHSDHIVNEVKKIVNNDLQDVTLEYVADKIGVSPVYLSKLFKQNTNINFKQYLLEVKMNYAKTMLKSSNKKVLEISKKIGYSDPKHFCRIFKKVTGLSPSKYRMKKC